PDRAASRRLGHRTVRAAGVRSSTTGRCAGLRPDVVRPAPAGTGRSRGEVQSVRPMLRAAAAAAFVLVAAGGVTAVRAAEPSVPPPTPKAQCGPGSMPETGLQGRVSMADVQSGRAAQGYTCNAEA